jgi:putative aldouronate transport system permease protein
VVGRGNVKTHKASAFDVANILFLLLLSFTILYPFHNLLILSFNETELGAARGIRLFPERPTLENYRRVFESPFIWRGYLNTIIRTAFGTFLSLLATGLGAYVLSKRFFPNRGFWTFFVVFTMFFNGGLIPTYLLVRDLGLIDTYLSMILPQLITGYNLVLMRNYFMSLPFELEESCLMDGANWFTIFVRIIIPISMPIIATIGLFLSVFHWNSWFDALIYLRNPDLFPMQIVLRRVILVGTQQMIDANPSAEAEAGNFSTEGIKGATIFVATVPILAVYPFVQKYFVKGIMIGSLKG